MKKIIILILLSSCQLKRYKVEITYCDQREKDTVYVDAYQKPSNNDINTLKMAVPKWNGRLNVCNLKTLSYKIIHD